MSTTLPNPSHSAHAPGTPGAGPRPSSIPFEAASSEASSPRVPVDRSGPLESVLDWACRRAYGRVLDPLRVAYHHRGVLVSYLGVELAAWVALENQRSRLNSGLGLTSQGFRTDCAVPSNPGP